MIAKYKQLISRRRLSPNLFLIEILEKLYSKIPEERLFGITELYESLSSPKPTFSSFRAQLSALELAGCIKLEISKEKFSKKNVELTQDFHDQIATDVYSDV